jgi:hypothetical protein
MAQASTEEWPCLRAGAWEGLFVIVARILIRTAGLSATVLRGRPRGRAMNAGHVSLQDGDKGRCFVERPADWHEILDAAFRHDLANSRNRRHEDQRALVLSESSERLDENAETKPVDAGELFQVDHYRTSLATEVIERLTEGRRRVGPQLAGHRDQGSARSIAHLDVQVHRWATVFSPPGLVADGPCFGGRDLGNSPDCVSGPAPARAFVSGCQPRAELNAAATRWMSDGPRLGCIGRERHRRLTEKANGVSSFTTRGCSL